MTEETTGKLIGSMRSLINLRRKQLSMLHVLYYGAEQQLDSLIDKHGPYFHGKDEKVRAKLMAIHAALNVGMEAPKIDEAQKLLNAEHRKDKEDQK